MKNLKLIRPYFLKNLFLITALFCVKTYAQDILISDGPSVTVSGGEMFYDAGGAAGNDGNTSYTITLLPATNGEAVCLDFQSFKTYRNFSDVDVLNIYDGLTVLDKAIGNLAGDYSAKYSNASVPHRVGQDGSTVGGTDEFSPGIFCATNANGALTLEFVNNFSNQYFGWEAEVITYVLANSNCQITYNAPTLVCAGTSFDLEVSGVVGNSSLNNDFNMGTVGTGWSGTNGSVSFTDVLSCEPNGGYTTYNTDNSTYLWMQNTTGARVLTTANMDVSNGGVLNFDYRQASDDAGGNGCESSDNDEGVFVQYSIDNGTTWETMKLMFPCDAAVGGYKGIGSFLFDWTKIAIPLPSQAQTNATMFRWIQFTNTSGSEDSWGLDNVSITSFVNATLTVRDLTNNVVIYSGAVLSTIESIIQSANVDYEIELNDGSGNVCFEYFTVEVQNCAPSCNFTAFANTDTTITPDCVNGTYDFTLNVSFTDAPSTGTIQLLDGTTVLLDEAYSGSAHTFNLNGQTIPANSNTINLTVQFSDETSCNLSVDLVEPLCTSCDFTIDSTIVDVSCGQTNDGAITITSTVANSELTYDWIGPNGFTSSASSLTGLEAGDYDFTITRNVGGSSGTPVLDTLFMDGFEDGGTQWTIANNGENVFIVNDVYAGASCNTNVGLFTVPDVPNQPAIIVGGPNSNYLHVMATTLCDPTISCGSAAFPPDNANFCSSASFPEVTLNTAFSTVGYSNVAVTFYWLAGASDVDDFGSVEYSIDNGANWVQVGSNLENSTSWTFESNTVPALDNQANVLLRIKWENDWGSSSDPAIAIDQIVVTGETPGNATPACTYTLTGTINVEQLVCPCPAEIGNIAVSIDGTVVTDPSNEYFVCANSTIELQATGYTLPNGANPTYAYAILTNYPTTADPYQDPAFLGDEENDLSTTLNNATYQGNTFYVVPVTLDEAGDSPDQLDADSDGCYAIGNIITIHFLNNYNVQATENCTNGSVDVTIQGAGPEVDASLYSYLNVQPGNVNAGNAVTHNGTTSLTGLVAGDQYSMTISDDYGCTYFFSGGPFVGINAGTADLMTLTCADNDGSIEVEVVVGTPDYTLTLNGNNIGTESVSPFTIENLSAGNYVLNITDANNCGMDLPFTLNAPLNPDLVVDPYAENCGQMDGEIDVIPSGGDNNYEFSLDGVNWQLEGFVNLAAGDYMVYVRDGNGCIDSAAATVANINNLVVAFDPSVYEGESPLEVTFENLSQNADQYFWDYGNGNTSVTVDGAQTYEEGSYIVTLIGTNNLGCIDSASVQIVAYPGFEIVIPNVFTPNGDGENDLFYITSNGVTEMNVQVFNRWGNAIANFDGLTQGWNGQNFSGEEMNSGVYFFMINLLTATGEEKSYSANVTLMR